MSLLCSIYPDLVMLVTRCLVVASNTVLNVKFASALYAHMIDVQPKSSHLNALCVLESFHEVKS